MQALIVTAGPFAGRICENDDNEFLFRDDLNSLELGWMEAAGVRWRYIDPSGDENEEPSTSASRLGVDCEVVTFGRYLLCRGHYFIPRQFVRPASMKDLMQRHQEIHELLFDAAWAQGKKSSKSRLYELLLEDSLIVDEIWDRETLARTTLSEKIVFLCHASADKPFVRHVRNDIAKAGHRPWIDEFEIKVGESIVQKISEASEAADCIILFLSKASLESEWVRREWQSALSRNLAGYGGRILPVLIEDHALPAIMSDIKYADFRQSYNEGLKELLAALD